MSYFSDIYLKRLKRFGDDYQSRVQGEREHLFDLYLEKTLYRVSFLYNEEPIVGSFERYKQDETETYHYLLTKVDVNIPAGEVLFIPNKDDELQPWLVYYLENIKASGYNRYVLIKLSHFLTWKDREGNIRHSWAYMYGQEDNMLKDELKSRSRMNTLYTENLKGSFFVMPINEFLRKDDYLEIGEGNLKEAYVVTGYDRQSTKGVEYVTVDPVYIRDNTTIKVPEPPEGTDEEYFWLTGGIE